MITTGIVHPPLASRGGSRVLPKAWQQSTAPGSLMTGRCPVVHTARHVDGVCCVAAEAALVSLGQR
eukprot:1374087-Prymnesium_polylepis.1